MKTILTSVGVAAALMASTAALAQKAPAAQVVTVDTQRISAECTACKAANTALQGQIASLQQRAQQLGTPLQTEEQAIRTSLNALAGKPADAALQKRITDFQGRQQAAQQEVQTREQQIQRNRQYVQQQIGQKLGPIFQSVMTARGANLMVDTGATLAAASTLDVTGDVLAQLNQQLPSVNTTAPAAPAQAPAQAPAGGR